MSPHIFDRSLCTECKQNFIHRRASFFAYRHFFSLQVESGISLGSSYLSPLTAEKTRQFEELWEAEVAAEGCGEATLRHVPVLFGRSIEVILSFTYCRCLIR